MPNRTLSFGRRARRELHRAGPWLFAAPMTILVTLLWWPTLFDGKSLMHGDTITLGVATSEYFGRFWRTPSALLWSPWIYGGHPIFAEGQGGFLHPLNIFARVLLPAVQAQSTVYWLGMLLAGTGTLLLCRALSISRAASAVASLAVVFSDGWLHQQLNPVISLALTWVPWTLWAAERWWRRPGYGVAAGLGTAIALMMLSGYPQVLHGTLIYLFVGFIARGRALARRSGPRARTLAAAILVGVGLSAIQWAPLLELTRQSIRANGTAIALPLTLDAVAHGFLYNLGTFERQFPVIGGLLICAVASLALVIEKPRSILGHFCATLALANLGAGNASPLFRFAYAFHLVPGLHSFRHTGAYLAISVVGIAVLVGFSLDALRKCGRKDLPQLGVLALLWITVLMKWPPPSAVAFAFVGPAALGVIAARLFRCGRAIPFIVLAAVAVEVVTLKLQRFRFASVESLVAPPAAVRLLREDTALGDFKIWDTSTILYGLELPFADDLETHMQRARASLAAMTNLQWGIASIDGYLALPAHRWSIAKQRLREELANPRLRHALLDALGIKYVFFSEPPPAEDFQRLYADPGNRLWLARRETARPRFQVYPKAAPVDSPEAAAAALDASHELIVESSSPSLPAVEGPLLNERDLTLLRDLPTEYLLQVKRPDAGGWLFLADAYYPGWEAFVDGKETPVYAAQVLGKALYVPPGTHEVLIRFRSAAVQLGAGLSLLTLLLMAIGGFVGRGRGRQGT